MSERPLAKKPYEAPRVRRVRLVVKGAVLGDCHSSPNVNPKLGDQTCTIVPQGCWNAPVIAD